MADRIRYPVDCFDDDAALLRLMEQIAENDGAMLIRRYGDSAETDVGNLDALCRKRMRRRFRADALALAGKRILRLAACILLAILLSGGLILFFSSEARATMLRWITRTEDDAVTYFAAEQSITEEFLIYEIDKLPEGYHKQEEIPLPGMEFYLNDAGDQLFFLYQPPDGSGKLYIIPGEDEILHVSVNGIPADLYVAAKEGCESNIVWTDPDTGYLLMLKGTFTNETLIELAESVSLLEE